MSEIQKIDVKKLKSLRAEKRPVVLIDVLPPDSFEEEHLPGARNACVYQVDFLDGVRQIIDDRARPVAVYASSSKNLASAIAAEKLAAAGYRKVFNFEGGIAEWREAGEKIEGSGKKHVPSGGSSRRPKPVLRIDPAKSLVEWTGRNIGGKHFGTIRVSDGEIRIEKGHPAQGEVTLDMNTIVVTDIEDDGMREMLNAHLRSEDFFDTLKYPEAKFVLSSIRPIAGNTPGAPNYTVAGTLTMKGIEHGVDFPAAIGTTPEGDIVAQASLEIDRTKWNVLYGSGKFFEKLGKHLVNDLVLIDLKIVAKG